MSITNDFNFSTKILNENIFVLKYFFQVVANQSDSFLCVAQHLIRLGDKQGDSDTGRQIALIMLARMNPQVRIIMMMMMMIMMIIMIIMIMINA